MATRIRKGDWNTYAVASYSYQVGDDPRATGGVHLHQVRRTRSGWQRRTVDSNGRFKSAGPVDAVSEAEGAALFARAESR